MRYIMVLWAMLMPILLVATVHMQAVEFFNRAAQALEAAAMLAGR